MLANLSYEALGIVYSLILSAGAMLIFSNSELA